MIEGVSMDVWRQVFDVNLFGTMQMAQACIEPWRDQSARCCRTATTQCRYVFNRTL